MTPLSNPFRCSRETAPYIEAGEDCLVKLDVKGVHFPNSIYIVSPSFPPIFFHHPIDFEWDQASWAAYNSAISKMDQKAEIIRATVVGLFESRVPINDLVYGGEPNGFGHLNGHPAQIVVKTMIDLRIEKKPQPKK